MVVVGIVVEVGTVVVGIVLVDDVVVLVVVAADSQADSDAFTAANCVVRDWIW